MRIKGRKDSLIAGKRPVRRSNEVALAALHDNEALSAGMVQCRLELIEMRGLRRCLQMQRVHSALAPESALEEISLLKQLCGLVLGTR